MGVGAPESSNWDKLTFGPVALEQFIYHLYVLSCKYRLYGAKSM